jgi:hypothetical protein
MLTAECDSLSPLQKACGTSHVTSCVSVRAVQVSLLPSCQLEPGFVGWLLEGALDAALVKVKGRTATLFRWAPALCVRHEQPP